MRQKDDVEYQHLLHRAKTCTLTTRLLNTGSKHNFINLGIAEILDLNDRYALSSLPPACVLVEYDQPIAQVLIIIASRAWRPTYVHIGSTMPDLPT